MGKQMCAENVQRNLHSIENNGEEEWIEWMVHPGYPSNEYGDDFSKSEDRRKEMEWLLSSDFAAIVEEHGLHLRSFEGFLSPLASVKDPRSSVE